VGVADLVDGAYVVDPGGLESRFQGTLLGLAAGNLLGIPVEGWPADAIRSRHAGGMREIDALVARPPWDDDLAQAAALAELLVADAFTLEVWAERLVRWWRENGRGSGMLTRLVIEELESGTPATEASRLVWERSGRQAAGNGAVMRCAPVALGCRADGARLVETARLSALATHYDPRCVWSTVATLAAIAHALSGVPVEFEELAEALAEDGAPPECVQAVEAVPGSTPATLDLDGPAMGYTLKAMQVGLWCLRDPPAVEEGMVEVVSAGGDTDTNGAVAGAVLGARFGLEAIPVRWLAAIPDRPQLEELTARLLALDRSA
jgi:ADP-ribosyl-[dinitrogen reductase] hydrolase